MAALTSARHGFITMIMIMIIVSLAAGESLKRNAEPGENVLLQCSSSTHAAITVLEWKRSELKDEYVFFFRDNELIEIFQNPRYRGRVQLNDPEMKNGDASVHLKNVSINDSGTYECWVITSQTRWKRAADEKPVASVHLIVSEGPEKEINDEQPEGPGGNDGLGVGLGVGLVCLIVAVGVGVGLVVKSKRAQLNRPSESVDVELNP